LASKDEEAWLKRWLVYDLSRKRLPADRIAGRGVSLVPPQKARVFRYTMLGTVFDIAVGRAHK
jgi:hypothetical protein